MQLASRVRAARSTSSRACSTETVNGFSHKNVLAGFECRAADRVVQRVGRQNMDSVDAGIFEQLLIISGGAVDSNALTELARPFGAGTGDRRQFRQCPGGAGSPRAPFP